MCFGGSSSPPPETPAPAPAPPPPDPIAQASDPEAPRRTEDKENYGSSTPSLRVDRSVTGGGVAAGGTGIKM